MKKVTYELSRYTEEVIVKRPKDLNKIFEGCSLDCGDPVLIRRFENETEALEALKAYRTEVKKMHHVFTYFDITEYAVCEQDVEVDEDGEEYACRCASFWTTPMVEEITFGADTYRYNESFRCWDRQEVPEE